MLNNIFFTPSLNSLFITGFIILLIFILFIINYKKIIKLDYYRQIILLCLIAIVLGVHGLIHHSVEINYNFNPYNYFNY